MVMLCTVFKSDKLTDTYLYVERSEGFDRVPELLKEKFGAGKEVLTFKLSPERRLASADPVSVLAEISSTGYYLQMPPLRESMAGVGFPESGTR
ncbi:MAG: hypothetical protein ACI9GW_002713 [Halieaceae bacterium]|jgi:uncharacterized protein YcgL (UPF0745 family)